MRQRRKLTIVRLVHELKYNTGSFRVPLPLLRKIGPEVGESPVTRLQDRVFEAGVVVNVDNTSGIGAQVQTLLDQSARVHQHARLIPATSAGYTTIKAYPLYLSKLAVLIVADLELLLIRYCQETG